VSGIVGIFRRDGAPVEHSLLRSLTRFLSYRGPDSRQTWSQGPVGFGHTMLRTTHDSACERQPADLDGRFWIAADARLDGRDELQARLESSGQRVRRNAPDSELILHAYAEWGEQCAERLRGDFAFAIWDARRKTLFCARDHLGIKPFYYAQLNDLFIFSNTLDCVRIHPAVSDELNDSAIADFLLAGLNCDSSTTTFRDIRRLPPAHSLTVTSQTGRVERYWSPPIDGCIRYKKDEDYVEHFRLLLRAAVGDRLRTDRAGILLSGGLDSSAVAATAREISGTSAVDLRAFTITYDSLFPDPARAHAGEVASFLRIPHRCLPMDDLQLFERWDDAELNWPEPVDDPFFAGLFDEFAAFAEHGRVALSGEGIDNLMDFEMWPYARHLLRNQEWRQLWNDVPRYLWLRPFPWRGIARRIRRVFGQDAYMPKFPRWLAPDFARRTSAQERWRECGAVRAFPAHPIVPRAHESLSMPQWCRMFELTDPGLSRFPVEVRYPFLDLRIVEFVLAIPPFPWAFQKKLLREAIAGRLPESVRTRPKQPLAAEPLTEMLARPEADWVDRAQWDGKIARYVNAAALPALSGVRNPGLAAATAIRPLCLNFWLRTKQRVRYKLYKEAKNGQAG
jgi:asparagine synthase (glutamine-hydrolysing)